MDDAYRYFTERVVTIAEDRRRIDQGDGRRPEHPAVAAWANSLAARINVIPMARSHVPNPTAPQHPDRELERTGIVELRQAINRLVETEIRKRVRRKRPRSMPSSSNSSIPRWFRVRTRWSAPAIAFLTAIALVLGTLLGCAIALLHHYRRAARRTG